MQQLQFDPKTAARASDPLTSHEAAEAAKRFAGRQHQTILAVHRAHPDGLIDDQVAALTSDEISKHVVGSRCAQLDHAGLVEFVDDHRATRANGRAQVRRLTERGHRYCVEHSIPRWSGARLADLAHPEAATKFNLERVSRTCQICGYEATGGGVGAQPGEPTKGLRRHLLDEHGVTVDWSKAG